MFTHTINFFKASIFYLVISNIAFAAVVEVPDAGNQLTAFVTVNISQDTNTHLYTYRYTVENSASSLQGLESFIVDVAEDTEIIEAIAPSGWNFGLHEGHRQFGWSAVDIDEGDIPANWDKNLIPSSYQIKPGESLAGFVIKTFSEPKEGRFYAKGFTRLPDADDVAEIEEAGYQLLSFPDDSFIGETTVPSSVIYDGNRRPAVDGFLGFVNLDSSNNEFEGTATIYLKFALNGEQVDRQTLQVILNGIDVTSSFVSDNSGIGDLVASFEPATSSLQIDKNVMTTVVYGLVPGTNRNAKDTDRITFVVNESSSVTISEPQSFDSSSSNN